MDFNPLNFLDLSEKLYSDSNYTCEATIRSIISRSYYAVILFVNNKLKIYLGVDFSLPERDMHKGMAEYLRSCGHPFSFIGNLLDKFRDKRNDADYDCHKTIGDADSIYAIRTAKQIKIEVLSLYPD